jgi:hypothetical protein
MERRAWIRRDLWLAYYFDHVQEIQEEMAADQAYVEEFRRNHPSRLDKKLGQEPLQEAS